MRTSDELLWRRRSNAARSAEDHAPDWPAGVHALSHEGLLLLGRDDQGRLHWDGRPVEVRRRPELTWQRKAVAAATAAAVILVGLNGLVQAINTAIDFGCTRHWWADACPNPPQHGRE